MGRRGAVCAARGFETMYLHGTQERADGSKARSDDGYSRLDYGPYHYFRCRDYIPKSTLESSTGKGQVIWDIHSKSSVSCSTLKNLILMRVAILALY